MPDASAGRPSRALRARSAVRVETGGVLRELRCQPPLGVRRVYGPPDECALCLVGTAAGPLPGDDLRLTLDVGTDARATLISAGASIALGADVRTARAASLRTEVAVAPGGSLDGAPPPLIVARGAVVESAVAIRLGTGAFVRWQETVVLGRAGERGGRLRMRWDVTRDGLALLRQGVDLGDPALARWPVMLHRRRVLVSVLLAGPGVAARTIVQGSQATAARLADDAVLITVLDDDAQDAQAQAQRLAAQLR